jgi:hypothetical protein
MCAWGGQLAAGSVVQFWHNVWACELWLNSVSCLHVTGHSTVLIYCSSRVSRLHWQCCSTGWMACTQLTGVPTEAVNPPPCALERAICSAASGSPTSQARVTSTVQSNPLSRFGSHYSVRTSHQSSKPADLVESSKVAKRVAVQTNEHSKLTSAKAVYLNFITKHLHATCAHHCCQLLEGLNRQQQQQEHSLCHMQCI